MDWERKPAWNIIGTIPGYDPLLTNDIVVLEGYYDAMSVVPALAPGAEQAASVTALLEIARHFRENPPARTIVFLATSAHHLGLRGVDDFIQRYLRKEDPFVDHMLVRRVVDVAIDEDLIAKDGVVYTMGREEFLGKESLVRSVDENGSGLVEKIVNESISAGSISASSPPK